MQRRRVFQDAQLHIVARRALADLFGPFGEFPVILGGKQALLDRQLAHRNFENFEVAYFLDHWRGWMSMVAVFVRLRHGWSFYRVSGFHQSTAGSSQRSGSSVC